MTPVLQAAFPDSLAIGRRTSVLVLGVGTHFAASTTAAVSGMGVTVNGVQALNPTAVRLDLTTSSSAATGPRDLTITTGTEVLTLTGGLTIIPGSALTMLSGAALSQGGTFLARIELSSGKQFATRPGGALDGARITSSAAVIRSAQVVAPSVVDVFGIILPTASTSTPPTLTVTFDDNSTEALTLPAVTAGMASPLPAAPSTVAFGPAGSVLSTLTLVGHSRVSLTLRAANGATFASSAVIFDAMGGVAAPVTPGTLSWVLGAGTYSVVVFEADRVNRTGSVTIASAVTRTAANATCAGAIPLTLGGLPLLNEPLDNGGSGPAVCPVPFDRAKYFSVTVPANTVVTIVGNVNTSLAVLDSCAATMCGGFAISTGGSTSVQLRNGGMSARTFILAAGTTNTTTISMGLSNTTAPVVPNDTCAGATMATIGTPLTNESLAAGGTPFPACQPAAGAQELRARYYAYTIPPASTLQLDVTGVSDMRLNAVSTCAATTCEIPSIGTIGAQERLLVRNDGAMPRNVVVSAGSTSTVGTASFTLSSALVPAAANATCATATTVTPGAPTIFAEGTAGGGAPLTACGLPSTALARYYSVTLPAQTLATLTAAIAGSPFDPLLTVSDTCNATTCEVTDATGGTSESVRLTNASAMPRTFIVGVVDSRGAGGVYSLTTVSQPIPTNGTCATAATLTPGMPLTNQPIAGGGAPSAVCTPTSLPPRAAAVWYSLTIPTSTSMQINAVAADFNPAVVLLDACAATSCGGTYNSSSSQTETLVLQNLSTTATRTVFLAVNDESGTGSTFSLSATATPIAPNATCATATPLMIGGTVTGESIGSGGAPQAACLLMPPAGALARHYSLQVPAATAVTAQVTGVGFDPTVTVVDSCAATTCVTRGQVVGDELVLLSNDTMTPRTFQLGVVDLVGAGGTYAIATAATPISTCAGATALSLGLLSNQNIAAGATAPTACLPTSNGPTVYFTLDVPAGESRSVRVNSTGVPFNPSLRALSSCTATTCDASSDIAGSIETLAVNNPTMAAVTFVIAVGSPAGTTAGTFSIQVSRPAFAVTRPMTACVDMSMQPNVPFTLGTGAPAVYGDDMVIPSAPLPFTFSFYGQAMTHAAFTTNGLMALSVGPGPNPPQSAYGAPIPTIAPPNNLIVAYWDDMNGNATTGANLRTQTSGMAPNRRFTVQWANVAPYVAGPGNLGPERLTFQVQLVETSNVIELHYCSAAANGGTSGFETGATGFIGVEDAAGTDQSIGLGANTPGTISTSQAYRLTPLP